jgi:CRISPR-associated protein Cas2
MCEIAPGVYTAPRMTRAVRDRVWSVMEEWWQAVEEQAVLMTWPDPKLAGGQHVRTLGLPRQNLEDHHGVFLACRQIDDETKSRLEAGSVPAPRPRRLEDAGGD